MQKSPASQRVVRMQALIQEMMALVGRHSAGETLRLMHEVGLTMPQLVALHVLRFGGPSSITGLVDALHLSTSATSHLVDRLVAMGLADRSEDPSDRRQKRVTASAAGVELIDRLNQARTAEFSAAFANVDPALHEQLVRAFEQVVEQLRRTAPGGGCAPREEP